MAVAVAEAGATEEAAAILKAAFIESFTRLR